MKEKLFLIALVALVILSGCQSQEQKYVKKAIRLMDKQGLFAEGPAWDQTREVTLGVRPVSMEEAHDVTLVALKVAGGKHSFIYTVDNQQESAAEDKQTAPSVTQLDDGILLIALPAFSGQTKDENLRYASTVLDALPEAEAPKGLVIDLRGNTGGNMYPMIAAVHRFLPDDDILRFKSRKYTMPITKGLVLRTVGISEQPELKCPVALLTDNMTASSGEATLLCFRGLENARTFGAPESVPAGNAAAFFRFLISVVTRNRSFSRRVPGTI